MKRSLISLWDRFAADENGAVSILAVGAIVAAIGVSVIVVDAGSLLYAKRQLQAATDAAAMSAVRDIGKAGGDPTARAEEALAANGFDNPKGLQVVPGGYDADESIAAANRFDAAADTDNAVKVMTSIDSPTYFAQFFGVPGTSEVYAESTAAMVDQASISAGTGLASLNDGVANNLLTALLGTAINLSAANYQGLVDTKIDALSFLDALATRVGVSGTYGDLLSADATVGDIVNAALDVLTSGDTSQSAGDPVAAQQAINALPGSALNALNLSVAAVIDASELQNRQIGNIVRTGTNDLKLNVYDLLIASVMAQANGQTIDLGTSISLPLAGTNLATRIAIGSPEASSKLGPVGTQVHTSQVRIALTATALNISLAPLATASITLPVYVEAAKGTATISDIPCKRSGTMVSVTGVTGVASAQLGDVSDIALSDFTGSPSLSDPVLVTLKTLGIPVADVSASATANLGAGGPAERDFTQSDIDNQTKKQVTSGLGSADLVSGLISTLNLDVQILTIPLGLTSAIITSVVNTLIAPVVVSLLDVVDDTVDQLLAVLGVQIGTLDMGVNGVSCGVPKLVG